MLKSKLVVAIFLCAVVALASAEANGPDDKGQGDRGRNKEAAAVRAARRSSIANASKRVPRFDNIAFNATPENRWLHEMLSKPIPPLDFPGETPLSEIMDSISSYYTTTYGSGAADGGANFRMTIYPDYAELDLEGITSLEDVTVRNISFEGIKLQNALKLIFDQTVDPELTYVFENQVMKITTLAKAESEHNVVSRVYNVGELADLDYGSLPVLFNGAASREKTSHKGGGVGYFSVPIQDGVADHKQTAAGEATVQSAPVSVKPCLATFIMGMTSPPAKWIFTDGEGGAIQQVGRILVVRTTPAVQNQIVHLLNMLDQAENAEQ